MTGSVTWALLPFEVEDELVSLAGRCLAADGGLPLAADPAFLRRRWLAAGVLTIQGRDHDGRLIAAGAVRPTTGTGGVTFCGLVDPGARGRGIGTRLLTWGLAQATRENQQATNRDRRATGDGQRVIGEGRQVAGSPRRVFGEGQRAVSERQQVIGEGQRVLGEGQQAAREEQVTVETESLTAAAEELFAAHGLRQVFAEDVMRIDLAGVVPDVVWPAGTELGAWSAADAARFHRVYEAAFRERPGFPGWSAGEWIAGVTEDDDFRPRWSVLATVPGLGDAGFVTASVDWIVQVGVVPAARGRGLGGALVTEALRRMRADGATQAWLDVNVDNPAVLLYRKLGFEHRGRRARFRLLGADSLGG